MRNQNLQIHFVTNLNIDLDEMQLVSTTCMCFEVHANFFVCLFGCCCFFVAQVVFSGENSLNCIIL